MQRYFVKVAEEERVFFPLPRGWECSHFLATEAPEERTPPLGPLLLRALSAAEVSSPLGRLAQRAKRPLIIVDDLTRPTPTSQILEALIPWLMDRGVFPEDLTVIVALGTHAPLDERQMEVKLGERVLSSCRVIQHDPRAPDLTPVAKLPTGQVVRINPAVAEADLRISIGSILPHPTAGFGGGKMIMPGVADFDSIKEHHLTYMRHPLSTLGNVDGNRFFEESLKIAEAVGIDLSIRCLYNRAGEVSEIIAGDFEETMREGTRSTLARLGHKMGHRVDICIISPLPYISGPQMLKALAIASVATRPGGGILFVTPSKGTLSEDFVRAFSEARERCGDDPLGRIEELLQKKEPILPDRSMDFNMAIFNTIERSLDKRVIFASPEIPKERIAAMGFEHATSITEGIARLFDQFPNAEVAIFPSGGFVIPVIEGGPEK